MKKRQSYSRYKKRHMQHLLPAMPQQPSSASDVSTSPTQASDASSDTVSGASASAPRRNILIHPDHKEDLDATYAKLEEQKVEVHDTGYTSHLRLVNRPSRWNAIRRAFSVLLGKLGFPEDYVHPIYRRRVLLHGRFVRSKLPTRTAFIFTSRDKHDPNRRTVYIQGCPVHYMQRTSVFHIVRRPFGFLRWYGYYADLDMTPEPQSILMATDRSPLIRSYTYKLAEQNGRDQHLNDVYNYRFIP